MSRSRMSSAETFVELKATIEALNKQVEGLEAGLVEAAEVVELKGKIEILNSGSRILKTELDVAQAHNYTLDCQVRDQDLLARDYTLLVQQIDDLFGVRPWATYQATQAGTIEERKMNTDGPRPPAAPARKQLLKSLGGGRRSSPQLPQPQRDRLRAIKLAAETALAAKRAAR